MESHAVVKACFQEKSPKQIAAELGISVTLLYKWAQPAGPGQSGARNPLDRVLALNAACPRQEIIKYLAQRCGGFFVDNPDLSAEEAQAFLSATNAMVQQFASLLGTVSLAGQDEAITPPEAARIRAMWEELKSFTEAFVTACEQGDYAQIRAQAAEASATAAPAVSLVS